MQKLQDATTGSINKHLITIALPLMLGNILQQFYNTVDAFIVGNYVGQKEMAAIGIAGTVMNLFLFAIVGGCTGFSVLFARYYGADLQKDFRKQHFTALAIGFIVSVLLGMMGLFIMHPILMLIKTPDNLLSDTSVYLLWIFISLPAAFIYNLYASLLRSCGDTRAALYILAVSILANVGLDILFVVNFQWGIGGAAKATALTQLLSAILCIFYMKKYRRELFFQKQDCSIDKKMIKNTLQFGIVTALHQTGLYIGKMLVQGAVNSVGTDTIVAYTAATRIEGFANSFGDSGAASTSIVTAQNSGAGKQKRVKETFRCSLKLLTLLGIVCSVILFITAEQTMGIMLTTHTGNAFTQAVSYMKIISLFYLFCFTGNTFAGYFDGIGKVSIPFTGAIGHILLRVVLSWIFIQKFELNAVAVATGIGWVLANIFWVYSYSQTVIRK